MSNITKTEILEYIPWDKTWIGTMAMLDLTRGFSQNITNFLDSQNPKELGGDFKTYRQLIVDWPNRYYKSLNAGQSGKCLRFIRFYSWLNGITLQPNITETLKDGRIDEITNNQNIINFSPEQLMTLDHHTTQWASIQYILTSKAFRRKLEPIFHQGKFNRRSADFKLRVTYEAVEHWESQSEIGEPWQPRKDPTFFNQAEAFIESLKTGHMCYTGEQAEDYCFERAFNLLDEQEGRLLYPSAEGHETKRFDEMERVIKRFNETEIIESKDHRVMQALVMNQIYLNKNYDVRNPDVVNKTWPKFWKFIDFVKINK